MSALLRYIFATGLFVPLNALAMRSQYHITITFDSHQARDIDCQKGLDNYITMLLGAQAPHKNKFKMLTLHLAENGEYCTST